MATAWNSRNVIRKTRGKRKKKKKNKVAIHSPLGQGNARVDV